MNSNSSVDNPYRPPETTDLVAAACDPLEFSGEITLTDYKRMLSTKTDIILGRVALLLGMTFFLPLVGATGVMIIRGIPGAGVAVVVASLITALMVGGANYYISTGARAKRYLRGHTDLLGPACGKLASWGLYFDDGKCKHWFSWAALQAVKARADGLRISLDKSPNRFLALSARIFLAYNRKHADRIVAEYSQRKRTSDELLIDSCDAFNKSVTDACFFCGTVSISQSYKSAELWTSVITGLITGVALILFAVFSVGYRRLVGLLGVYCLIDSAQRYRLYMYGSQLTDHLAWGWIDAEGLIYAVNSLAIWRPQAAFSKIVPQEQYVELHLVSGECLFVYYEHMKNQSEFMQVANNWRLGT